MQAESMSETSLERANELAQHLRKHPEDAMRNPGELALRFGLSEEFVQNVLRGIQVPVRREAVDRPRISFGFVYRLFRSAGKSFDRATRRPMLFIFLSFVIGTILTLILGEFSASQIRSPDMQLIGGGAMFLVIVSVFFLHMLTYFHRQMARHALYGGLIVWLTSAPVFMYLIWVESARSDEATRFGYVMLTAFMMFMLSAIYAGLGSLAAVAGGYYQLKRAEFLQERMTRQELLERYFELQNRLANAQENGQAQKDDIFESSPIRRILAVPIVVPFFVGFAIGLLRILVAQFMEVPQGAVRTLDFSIFFFGVLAIVLVLTFVAIGFFSRGLLGSIANSAACYAGTYAARLPAMYVFNMAVDNRNLKLWPVLGTYAFFLGITLIATAGAAVQRKAQRDRNLQENDPATILAEMVRLQWQLGDATSNVCVMVVDAAKSSEMKLNADPLAVEFSFREYQAWIADICRKLGGRVHSTAGDGAVVAFDNAHEAFLAAKLIQTDLARFNREENRLSKPFRLRIGLHLGSIAGDLDKVEFTEVIDIAAHVQAAAPVAGIAVTEEVAARLTGEEFLPLANSVDEHRVFLAQNPVADA